MEGIIFALGNIGIVATADELIVDNNGLGEVEGKSAGSRHTAHVAAYEERTDICCLVDIICVEGYGWLDAYIDTPHILFKGSGIGQFHAVDGSVGIACQSIGVDHVLSIGAEEHVVHNHM